LIYGTNLIGITGSYDEVNRLCSEIAENYRWAFVNINIRSANVTENVGWVTLEIDGEEGEYLKALDYLKKIGVKAEPVEKDVIE